MTRNLGVIIGLEVHAQVNSLTKMFCSCSTDAFGKEPNTTVCEVCMGHPGTLPVPNATVVEKAIRMSLALQCTVNSDCHFDRKHYFYPDLPFGFQISQYDYPLASKGKVSYELGDESKICGITRLHLENDAGKLSHRGDVTLCDYNRAGAPLMEIVTEPDLRSAQEAVAFAQELRRILLSVDASEADMFKGMMRFDASISLREVGTTKLNPRSEIKNLNSFRALERALQYEEERLKKIWDDTGSPLPGNITVGWMDDEGRTRLLRDKESADDYRYFPEPDIPPLVTSVERIAKAKAGLPRLPGAQREHYAALGLTKAEVTLLLDESRLQKLFDAVETKTGDGKRASSLILSQLLGFLNAAEKTIEDAPSVDDVLALVDAVEKGTISGNAAKSVLEKMVATGKTADVIIKEEGMGQISDTSAIEALVKKAIDANPKALEDFKNGKQAALGAIVGFVMKETKGQANPKMVNDILKKFL